LVKNMFCICIGHCTKMHQIGAFWCNTRYTKFYISKKSVLGKTVVEEKVHDVGFR
jgi:hypothetical protein